MNTEVVAEIDKDGETLTEFLEYGVPPRRDVGCVVQAVVAILLSAMFLIVSNDTLFIKKSILGGFKQNPMLFIVGTSFFIIPFKCITLHLRVIITRFRDHYEKDNTI